MWAQHGDAGYGLGSSRNLSEAEGREVAKVIGLDKAHVMKVGNGQNTVGEAIKAGIADVKEALTKWVSGEEEMEE